jgi:hypothetical protein
MKVTFKNNLESVLFKTLFFISIVIAYLLVALMIQPSLILFAQKTGFLLNHEYFTEFTSIPGGISLYITNFLMQFFLSNWVGALVIMMIFSLLISIISSLANRLYNSDLYKMLVIIVIIGFGCFLITDYHFYYTSLIKLLISVLFAWILLNVLDIKKLTFLLLLIPFAIMVFYMAGAMSMFLFSIIVLLNSRGLFEKKILNGVYSGILVLINVIVCLVSYRLCNIDTSNNWLGFAIETPVFLRYTQVNLLYVYYC